MATAHLTWTPSPGLQQEVQYKKASDASYTVYQTVSDSTNSIDIPGLDDNVVYDFLIMNKCVYNYQTPTSPQQEALVTCPTLTIDQAALSLTVNFSHLGGEVSQYTVQLYQMPAETFVTEGTISSPTSSMSWTFTGLSSNTNYKIKVIPKIGTAFENDNCSVTQRTLGCASDYTLAPDGSYCYKIDEVAATPPSGGTAQNTVASSFNSYGQFGTYIYDPGFNVNGTGTSSQIPTSNAFWINGPSNTTSGPLNRCGLWTTSALSNQDIGFSVCINITDSKQYYVGIGGDNRCRILIDGVVVVDQNVSALATQYSTDAQVTFKLWHVYPVTLTSGPHIIELIGHNDSGAASLGAEIYNNTAAELISATSYSGLTLVFSTKDYIGQPVQLASGGLGYSCPSGYALAACQDPYVCRKILTATPT
jgi:hypothetical protein